MDIKEKLQADLKQARNDNIELTKKYLLLQDNANKYAKDVIEYFEKRNSINWPPKLN